MLNRIFLIAFALVTKHFFKTRSGRWGGSASSASDSLSRLRSQSHSREFKPRTGLRAGRGACLKNK